VNNRENTENIGEEGELVFLDGMDPTKPDPADTRRDVLKKLGFTGAGIAAFLSGVGVDHKAERVEELIAQNASLQKELQDTKEIADAHNLEATEQFTQVMEGNLSGLSPIWVEVANEELPNYIDLGTELVQAVKADKGDENNSLISQLLQVEFMDDLESNESNKKVKYISRVSTFRNTLKWVKIAGKKFELPKDDITPYLVAYAATKQFDPNFSDSSYNPSPVMSLRLLDLLFQSLHAKMLLFGQGDYVEEDAGRKAGREYADWTIKQQVIQMFYDTGKLPDFPVPEDISMKDVIWKALKIAAGEK